MRDREILRSIARRAHRIGHRVELSLDGLLNIVDPNDRTIGRDLELLDAMYQLDVISLMREAAE